MNSYNAARFTAWSAILGGLAACATIALSVVVTGGDIEMVPHGPAMLALPAQARDLFRWWMLADVLGFYLPFVAIGGYFLHTFREELGALREMIAIANATQSGFWWVEGPLVFFWTPIAGRLLKKAGWRGSFLLHIVGWGFGCYFVFGFFPSLASIADAGETIAVLALPIWMLIFGWQLMRRAPTLAVPNAARA